MDASPFYRSLDGDLYQGDIFERVPLVYIKDAPTPLTKATLQGKKEGFYQGDPLSPSAPPPAGSPLIVAAPCDHTRAILLTYDCEIDKRSTKLLTFALIRPLDAKMPEEDKAIIRNGEKFAFFYLPPGSDGQENYVDFRRICTVGIDFARSALRIARLSEDARKSFMFQFYRYLTRIDLSLAVLPPPTDEAAP